MNSIYGIATAKRRPRNDKNFSIGVVDYGMGNLHSVAKALATTGARIKVSDSKTKLSSAQMLVVPGVGSFGAAMTNLAKKRLDDFILKWIESGKPFLGICLGLQLLFDRSEESPRERGLGVFPGNVVKFRPAQFRKGAYQVPHMGWNTTRVKTRETFGISKNDYFYFVHTYFPAPRQSDLVFTETDYGRAFCSGIYQKNLIATQFHPEKSGDVGLNFLSNVVHRFRKRLSPLPLGRGLG